MLASLLFAAMAVCAKEAARHLPGAEIACLRFILGAATVLGLAAARVLRLRAYNPWALLLRGTLGGSGVLLYFMAISHLPVGVATLLNNSSPLFVAVFSWLFLREPFSVRTLFALMLTSLGVVLVVLGNAPAAGGPALSLKWVLMGLGSAVFAGGAVTTMRAMRKREGAWEIFLALCVIGGVITGVPTVFEHVWPTSRDWFWVALTGVFSVGSQVLLTYSLRDVPAVRAGLILQLTPILTFVLGALWLAEFPSWLGWLGSAVTIGGVSWGMLTRRSG
ncbi:MAG: DMT family transporter [Polyangia bacterium]